MLKKCGKKIAGVFLAAAMLAGTPGTVNVQKAVKASENVSIKASGGQITLKNVSDYGILSEYSISKAKTVNIKIKVPKESTIFLDFFGVRGSENGNAGQKKNWTIKFQGQKWTGRSIRIVKHLKKGTYTLTGSISEAQYSAMDGGYVDSGSGRFTSTKSKIKEGMGKWNYQTFKVKKKSHFQTFGQTIKYKSGIMKTDNYSNMITACKKSVPFYLQKKDKKGKYTNVTNRMSFTSKKTSKHFALSPGSYRLKTKTPKGYVSQFVYKDTVYKNRYAVTKAKAKLLTSGSKKSNLFTDADKAKKTHYYKFKVAKDGKISIRLTTKNNSGRLKAAVYGKGMKTKKKTMEYSGTHNFNCKLKKGTYYVKVTKDTKKSIGLYSLTYTDKTESR